MTVTMMKWIWCLLRSQDCVQNPCSPKLGFWQTAHKERMTPIKQTKLYIARNVHDFLKRFVKMNKDDIIVIDLIDILIN